MAIDPIERLLRKYQIAKQTLDEVTAEVEQTKAELMTEMGEAGVDSYDGVSAKATIVVGTRIIIDDVKLKKELGAPMWKKVTKEVLDTSKLEAHVATGDIDPNKVAMCSEEVTNKPYIKLTVKKPPQQVTRTKKRSPASPLNR